MSRRKISQREARRLKRRVAELERQDCDRKARWASYWPNSVSIDTINVRPEEWYIVRTARLLGHAVVVLPGDEEKKQLKVFGVKL